MASRDTSVSDSSLVGGNSTGVLRSIPAWFTGVGAMGAERGSGRALDSGAEICVDRST